MGINWLSSDLSDGSQFGHVVGCAFILSVLDQLEVIMFWSSTPQEQIS